MSTVHDDAVIYDAQPLARTDIDWSERDPITMAVTRTLTRVAGVELSALDPLDDAVDTDALERLFRPGDTEDSTVATVEFVYADHVVVVGGEEVVVWRKL